MSGETARDGAASELRDQIAEALQMAFVALLGNHETSTTGPLTYETLADAVMAAPALRVRLDLLAEYENAITWNTSCLACSRTLDASIRDHDRAERAEAAIEQYHMLINKMRHGEHPFGGSAADSADILDAALDQAGTEDNEEPNQPVNWQAIVPEVLPAPMAYRLRPGERPRGETTIHLPGDDR
jgi:hypothetical protein